MIVCIIDDNKVFQILTQKLIAKSVEHVKQVLQFGNGRLALDYILKHQNNKEKLPDLIFLDLNMPIMNGWEFLRSYKDLKLNKRIPIHITSSSVDPRDMEKAKDCSVVSRYIIKPLKKDILERVLLSD